jgi:hypothetical protein
MNVLKVAYFDSSLQMSVMQSLLTCGVRFATGISGLLKAFRTKSALPKNYTDF